MTRDQMAKAFNEWMRRNIVEPERFEREFQTVRKFLVDEADGREPSYGEEAATLLQQIAVEISAPYPMGGIDSLGR